MNYTEYGGSAQHPQAVTRGGGGQLRTPKLSLADAGGEGGGGGGPSSDIVTTFALFLILWLP